MFPLKISGSGIFIVYCLLIMNSTTLLLMELFRVSISSCIAFSSLILMAFLYLMHVN